MKKRIPIKSFQLLLAGLLTTYSIAAQSPLDVRIDSIIGQMSNQEKINQLINSSFGGTPGNYRLNISGLMMDDGPHGVRFATDRNERSATAFPTGIAMAATWDETTAQQVGKAMGTEFWAFNRSQQLGPCIDIAHDPRGGRTAESGGEDGFLAGHMGKAVAIGIQQTPVIATIKHYMGESKQANRHKMDVRVNDRYMMDFGARNFRIAIQESGAMSVMGAYNLINGDKACESSYAQTTVLRQRWGYPFYVVSDWDAIWDSQKAIHAGTDICMGSDKYAHDLPELVASGKVSTEVLNRAVKHVLRTKILNGMTDFYPRGDASLAKTDEIKRINRLAAQKSIILLKNNIKKDKSPILPLNKKNITIALIGPNATAENLNCYGSSETFPSYAISIKTGLENKIGAENILYAKGCDINSNATDGFTQATDLAKKADIVIFAGGLDATQEGEGYNTGHDRASESIALPGQQQNLINQLAAVNPNIVAVIQSGGICSLNNSINQIKGLIYSFYAAQEAGHAIADVIFGDYNPAGRLPMSMPKLDSDLPSWDEDTFRKFDEHYGSGYRWYDEKNITPEFAFGFGLSYTTFAYSNLLSQSTTEAGAPVIVSVDVTNTGSIAGEEVVQLYLASPSTISLWMPKKELRGFKRIALKAGETQRVKFTLSADEFYHWDNASAGYKVNAGKYTLLAGGSSDKLPLKKKLVLTNGAAKPDLKITQLYTMPRYPLQGQKVTFYALVKNQGNANCSKTPYQIQFEIGGSQSLSTGIITNNIEPGQVQLIASEGEWICDKTAATMLNAKILFTDPSSEWNPDNNRFTESIECYAREAAPELNNKIFRKKATTSSSKGENNGELAADGDLSSRWESDHADNQFIAFDMGSLTTMSQITLHWETAYAKSYQIETSTNGTDWDVQKNMPSGNGKTETITFPSVQAQHIRINCNERADVWGNKYGFSIYEIEVK